MTTGTIAPYLKRPEDINPPQPNKFFNVFWMVHSYLNLVLNTPNPAMGRGIIKLYSYRMGVLTPDTSALEKVYIELLEKNSNRLVRPLADFGNSMIAYNLITLYRLLTNTIISDINRGFGNDNCLTSDAINAIGAFCRFNKTFRSWRDGREDNINDVVETLRYNALYDTKCVSSLTEIITLIETIDRLITRPIGKTEYDRRHYLMNLVRIIFYIGCKYYGINLLRFTDQNIKRPYTRNLQINDFTLAAIPFDPTMIFACTDDGGTMSRFGVEYVQSLNAVLSAFSGIEAIVNFPQ
jgi:hypothetical protein